MESRTALIVIDMQNDFARTAPPEFSSELVSGIATCLAMARARSIPIAHVITEYHDDKSDWPAAFSERSNKEWRCIRGTHGAAIVDPLSPSPTETVITKTRYSAFYNTRLEEWLRANGIARIALCGYAIDVCVRMTAIDAYNRNYPIVLVSDCLLPERSTLSESIQYLEWLTNCDVCTMEEWLGGPQG